jgi:hypothetical protein
MEDIMKPVKSKKSKEVITSANEPAAESNPKALPDDKDSPKPSEEEPNSGGSDRYPVS